MNAQRLTRSLLDIVRGEVVVIVPRPTGDPVLESVRDYAVKLRESRGDR